MRVVLVALLAGACGRPPPAPVAPDAAPRIANDLVRIVALARECVAGQAGRSGSPLAFEMGAGLTRRSATMWAVSFSEQSPTRRPYGLEVEVDAASGTCGGRAIALASPPRESIDADAVLRWARECATRPPVSGRGVAGSALDLGQPRIAFRQIERVIVSYPEVAPRAVPSGRDLVIRSIDGECGLAPMD